MDWRVAVAGAAVALAALAGVAWLSLLQPPPDTAAPAAGNEGDAAPPAAPKAEAVQDLVLGTAQKNLFLAYNRDTEKPVLRVKNNDRIAHTVKVSTQSFSTNTTAQRVTVPPGQAATLDLSGLLPYGYVFDIACTDCAQAPVYGKIALFRDGTVWKTVSLTPRAAEPSALAYPLQPAGIGQLVLRNERRERLEVALQRTDTGKTLSVTLPPESQVVASLGRLDGPKRFLLSCSPCGFDPVQIKVG